MDHWHAWDKQLGSLPWVWAWRQLRQSSPLCKYYYEIGERPWTSALPRGRGLLLDWRGTVQLRWCWRWPPSRWAAGTCWQRWPPWSSRRGAAGWSLRWTRRGERYAKTLPCGRRWWWQWRDRTPSGLRSKTTREEILENKVTLPIRGLALTALGRIRQKPANTQSHFCT